MGKGIVYDTGGLSIKVIKNIFGNRFWKLYYSIHRIFSDLFSLFIIQGKTAMPGMKRDCGGAAGILGAFYAAVKQGILIAIIFLLSYQIPFSI